MHWADRRASVAVPDSLSDARMAGIGALLPVLQASPGGKCCPIPVIARRHPDRLRWVGYLPLAPGVSNDRYPIRQRTFKYVATVQSVTDETCQLRTRDLQEAAVLAVVGGWRKIIV
jgi:hypothetical protein